MAIILFRLKHLTFTVTNDLNFDQRMQRICITLAQQGYTVTLVGRKLKKSLPISIESYMQKRLFCFFSNGKMMYFEYNVRLFFYLLFTASDCFIAIDLDTILPNYFVSLIRRKKRVYDAHELFSEQKEIVERPFIRKIWLAIERFAVPKYTKGYTVNEFIKNELNKNYGVKYEIIRNLPAYLPIPTQVHFEKPFIIYQGAVNEGRSFETLIPAMKMVEAKLIIYGDGNFMEKLKKLIIRCSVEEKVELKGLVSPDKLRLITPKATVAIMLFEKIGLNQYQSLANRFFDYIMAGVPQVCVNYPQYKAINDEFEVASMIDNTDVETIALSLNNLLKNDVYQKKLKQNCLLARQILNWDKEKKILIEFYHKLFL